MTLIEMGALFVSMALLAAIPSTSVAAVSARSASHGFMHGALASGGILVGDLLFILVAMFGLAALTEALGDLFFLVRYLGGAYLIWLSILLWRSRRSRAEFSGRGDASLWSSFMIGLLITLGDHKALLFYLGFLPAFIDLAALSPFDVAAVVLITIAAVGGVKLGYAFLASRASGFLGNNAGRAMNTIAACLLFVAGVMVIGGGLDRAQ